MKVLLINAHHVYPGWSEGNLNAAAFEVAKDFFLSRGDEVIETHIDSGYDPEDEERKHLEADLVILQTPINWFSAPWTWKKYVDETFNVGLHNKSLLSGDGRTRSDSTKPYGSGGKMMGRKFMVSATWNAPADAFDNVTNPVFVGRGVDDVFSSIVGPYAFSGYEILPSYNIFDVFKNPTNDEGLANYAKHLERVLSEPVPVKAEVKKRYGIDLERLGLKHYKATNDSGASIEFGSGEGLLNPVELLLAAVAGCASIDVDVVTSRRTEPAVFKVRSEGDRLDEGGAARLENVEATFDVEFPDSPEGQKAEGMVERLLRLAHDRDCTVSRTVENPTHVRFSRKAK
ncbi:NAD(P)H-dependent oxidoreductase [Arcanobacterium haemolyticum]|nr:NAD(P)H-dependent oxidoreductase [Arcanobacterium haemolyticum]